MYSSWPFSEVGNVKVIGLSAGSSCGTFNGNSLIGNPQMISKLNGNNEVLPPSAMTVKVTVYMSKASSLMVTDLHATEVLGMDGHPGYVIFEPRTGEET